MVGAADALQAGGDRGRGLELDDEVDGAHVDAELHRGGGDDRGEGAALEAVLDVGAGVLGHRAVVGEGDLLAGELVEGAGEALGEAAAVDEDHRRAVGPDQLDQARVDRGPDRLLWGLDRGGALGGWRGLGSFGGFCGAGLGGELDAEVDAGLAAGVDDRDGAGLDLVAGDLEAAEEGGDLLERALGGGQADALQRRELGISGGVEALEREGEVGAALGGDEAVDLVDDDGLDAAQELARVGGEHQVQRFGGGDEDVGRAPLHLLALTLRGVAAAHADGERMERGAEALCGGGDAGERRTQVALDVDAERLDRRDIHDAAALGLGGDGREHQAIDGAEEGGEGLAGAGGGEQQGGGAAGDRGPAEHLRGGGGLEAGGEPRARGRVQEGQRIDGGGADGCRCTGHRGADYRRDAAIGHCAGL
jgi:hypothetical protein